MKKLELKIPPAFVFVIIGFCMWIVKKYFPSLTYHLPLKEIAASIFSIAGGVIGISAIISFLKAKTTIHPMKIEDVNSLVVSGVYSFSRNPMYLSLLLILIGWSFFLSNIHSSVFLIIFILYMNTFQIIPEEKILESKFGKEFIEYKSRVRRWL